jgi:hypothetical protein
VACAFVLAWAPGISADSSKTVPSRLTFFSKTAWPWGTWALPATTPLTTTKNRTGATSTTCLGQSRGSWAIWVTLSRGAAGGWFAFVFNSASVCVGSGPASSASEGVGEGFGVGAGVVVGVGEGAWGEGTAGGSGVAVGSGVEPGEGDATAVVSSGGAGTLVGAPSGALAAQCVSGNWRDQPQRAPAASAQARGGQKGRRAWAKRDMERRRGSGTGIFCWWRRGWGKRNSFCSFPLQSGMNNRPWLSTPFPISSAPSTVRAN